MTRSRGIGRGLSGDAKATRLSSDSVRELRRRVAAGATIQAVADWAGCAWTTAYKAATGLTWAEVGDVPPVQPRRRWWTGDEIIYLASHPDDRSPDVAEALGRSALAVRLKRHREEL